MENDIKVLKLIRYISLNQKLNHKALRVIMYLIPQLITENPIKITHMVTADNLNLARSDVSKSISTLIEAGIVKKVGEHKQNKYIELAINMNSLDELIKEATFWEPDEE